MNVFLLYILAFVPVILAVAPYVLLRKFNKLTEKINHIYVLVLGSIALFMVGVCIFHIKGVMIPHGAEEEIGVLEGGCINLIGEPYGEIRGLNFLAWLSNALVLPGILIVGLSVFFPNRVSKLINTYIALPVAFLEAFFVFNFINSFSGNLDISFQNIILALEVGFSFALSFVLFIRDFKEGFSKDWKEITYAVVFYITVFLCSLPVNTFATLFNPTAKFLGALGKSWRVIDFSQMHRVFIYVGIIVPVAIYFINRDKDLNTKKVLMIAIAIGVLSLFLKENGAYDIFERNEENRLYVDVNNLPIHLCHTALYVLPICIAFNKKRLFYFTYFINVFGAVMAMLWPNTGENSNYLSPSVIMFWYNHIAAYSMPLLTVALGIFEKPKMKQMFYSLAFFAAYMFLIVIANSWLSNYVKDYDPNVIGSGTDYLFINGTYILDLLSKQAFHMLDIKLQWTWGNLTFVIYPLYQSIFFIGYIAIAFGMWFVYSLFFTIADAHKNLHYQVVVMRKEGITFKERMKMAELNNELIDHTTASLKYTNFSKRYGNSKRLSANNVNLEVKAGEIFGFLGPNGAGKSTCIKTTIGIQPVTEGSITVCGFDVSKQSVESKKLIGYVPDHYALYEKLTGREYINYIADLYNVSKEDRDARISKYVDLFELEESIDNKIKTYSHGMKQKITIIAALVHNPKVWILDEPLTGLDPQSIYQVKEVMKEHAKAGNIVFFSSHIINVVEKLCTRIAIIKKGQIVYVADMKDVEKEHPEGLEEFYMKTIRDNGDLDE